MKREIEVTISDFWLDNGSSVVNAKFKVKIRVKFPSQIAIYRTITL